jgi:predicted ATPase
MEATSDYWKPVFYVLEAAGFAGEAVRCRPQICLKRRGTKGDFVQPPADLVGRDAEIAALLELVPAHPLVTVTGVGGVGKTSLALRVAALLEGSFADGVRVCELAPESDPAAVPATVTGQLGVPSLAAAPTAFGDAALLVVLDNCEHVLDAAAAVATALVASGAGIRVLATSREPLAVEPERVVVIDTLAVPASDDLDDVRRSPAAQMFCERAVAAGTQIALDAATAAPIASVCRRLDGLPLALQLAAARSRTLTPAEIDQHLDDRFRLLTTRVVRGSHRHRSLRAAVDWSYDLLDAGERRFFDALGVFDDRFTVEAAQHVAGLDDEPLLVVVARLDGLVQRSLVTVESSPIGSRYRLLETLRDYARDRLADRGELDATRDRHLDHLAETTRSIHLYSCTAWEPDVFMRLFIEYESVRAATEWCIAHDDTPHRAFTLFLPQWMAIDNAKPQVVADLGQRLLARWPGADEPEHAAAAAITAWALAVAGDAGSARRLAERTAAAARGGFVAVAVCRLLCMLENVAGRPAHALRWAEQANTAARADGLAPFACELYAWRAQALHHLGRHDEARANALAMRDEAARLQSANLQVAAMLVQGNLLAGTDDAAARDLFGDGTRLARAHQIPWGTGNGLRACGAGALIAGDVAAARVSLLDALQAFASAGNEAEVWWTLRWIAALLARTGRHDDAARLLGTPPAEPPVMVMNMLEGRFLPGLLGDLTAMSHDTGAPATLRDAIVLARATLASSRPASHAQEHHVAAPAARSNRYTLDGDFWTLTFDGHTVRLHDAKGLRDLARLLHRAGEKIHCLDLLDARVSEPDTGPVLDHAARRAYEARVRDLRVEVDEAEAAHDLERARRSRDELDALVDQLAAAAGLAGRSRRTGASAERARSAVGWRIRAALKRIEQSHPALGRHLARSVRIGTWCVYDPSEPVGWHL